MFEQISTFFTVEMIYLWLNFGIIPSWIILIFFPQSNFCRYFIASIIPYFILTPIYIYLFYNFYISGFELTEIFRLYAGIDELIDLFSSSSFLILFWIHFLAINLLPLAAIGGIFQPPCGLLFDIDIIFPSVSEGLTHNSHVKLLVEEPT